MGIPVVGGLIDSVLGIVLGAGTAIAAQVLALLHSLPIPLPF
jgi:hypothetical protein